MLRDLYLPMKLQYIYVAGDDGEYEIVETPFRQPKTADVTVKNPAYVE